MQVLAEIHSPPAPGVHSLFVNHCFGNQAAAFTCGEESDTMKKLIAGLLLAGASLSQGPASVSVSAATGTVTGPAAYGDPDTGQHRAQASTVAPVTATAKRVGRVGLQPSQARRASRAFPLNAPVARSQVPDSCGPRDTVA
jgi:hypothetical protein